ncbi:MAG: hypothetical protein ACRDIE_17650, partial [Chloroflexota bacterium]
AEGRAALAEEIGGERDRAQQDNGDHQDGRAISFISTDAPDAHIGKERGAQQFKDYRFRQQHSGYQSSLVFCETHS